MTAELVAMSLSKRHRRDAQRRFDTSPVWARGVAA